ncbi:hypothetical protein [Aeoliella sp.]|uniref:hypothetical protein n=1 Tax=Aeoliella sp. TaxID=2795800 RepID=UPI003CCBD28C
MATAIAIASSHIADGSGTAWRGPSSMSEMDPGNVTMGVAMPLPSAASVLISDPIVDVPEK